MVVIVSQNQIYLYPLFQYCQVTNRIIIIPKLIKKKKIHHCPILFLEVAHYVQSRGKCINILYGIPLDLVDCSL